MEAPELERWLAYKRLAERAINALGALLHFLDDPASKEQVQEAERHINISRIREVNYQIGCMRDRAYQYAFYEFNRIKETQNPHREGGRKHGKDENHNSGNPSGKE